MSVVSWKQLPVSSACHYQSKHVCLTATRVLVEDGQQEGEIQVQERQLTLQLVAF